MAVRTDLEISSVKYKDKEGNTTNIPVKSGGGTDMLQARVDETKSCAYLFYRYKGNNSNIVKNLNTTGVTSMEYMFSVCSFLTNLDVSNLNTVSVTSMYYMLSDCTSLTSLDLSRWNTSSVKSMYNMFGTCTNLTELDLSSFNTSEVTSMSQMFKNCNALQNIIGVLDLIKCTSLSNMFQNCTNLTTVTLKNIKKALTIGSGTSYGTLLTDDTIVNTFKELHDLTGSTTQTLTLSTPSKARTEAIYVKLIDITDEMRAEDPYIDNKKPCVVCESTDEGAMTLKEYGISKNWNIA